MNKFIINCTISFVLLLPIHSMAQDQLTGKWDLTYFSAIDKIEFSPAMQLADTATYNQFLRSKKIILEQFYYHFFEGGRMEYCDIENSELIIREAFWSIKEDVLTITELKRPLERQAKLLKLSGDELELSLMIDGEASPDSKLVFERMEQ